MQFRRRGRKLNNNSSIEYNNKRSMTIWQRLWFWCRTLFWSTWNLLQKGGWVLSTGFIILLLPTFVVQMIQQQNLYSQMANN